MIHPGALQTLTIESYYLRMRGSYLDLELKRTIPLARMSITKIAECGEAERRLHYRFARRVEWSSAYRCCRSGSE